MPRRAFPISLYLANRRVLVVEGDAVAANRVDRLRDADAEVVRLPLDVSDEAVKRALVGATALFAHTGDRARDRELARIARQAGAMAYAHDQPDESDFAMPAVARRGPLKVAISTGGTAPALSRRLRELLDDALDSAEIDELIDELVALRHELPLERRGEIYETAKQLALPTKFVRRNRGLDQSAERTKAELNPDRRSGK